MNAETATKYLSEAGWTYPYFQNPSSKLGILNTLSSSLTRKLNLRNELTYECHSIFAVEGNTTSYVFKLTKLRKTDSSIKDELDKLLKIHNSIMDNIYSKIDHPTFTCH